MNLDNISKVECTGDAIPSACIILTMTIWTKAPLQLRQLKEAHEAGALRVTTV